MKLRFTFLLALVSAAAAFGALAPTAPVLLRASPSTVTPSTGQRVVLWAAWAEAPSSDTVPTTIRPAAFDVTMAGESYTLWVGPSEGSVSMSTDATYSAGSFDNPAGRLAPLWADSRGNYGVVVQQLNAWTPVNSWDYAFSTGTSRTLGYEELNPTYYRFHFPNSVVTLNGVVEKIDAAGTVLVSGTYHAVRFGSTTTLTEYAAVTWYKDGQKITRHDLFGGETPDWFDIPSYSSADYGTYKMHVENSKGSIDVLFRVGTPPPVGAPSITAQPQSTSATAGGSATFTVTATGTALSYQWRFNSAAIAGATSSSFSVSNITSANAGVYDCVVTNTSGSVTTAGATLTVNNPPTNSSARLLNISTRSGVGTGDNILIAGLVISGPSAKRVIIRAAGPALVPLGVSGALADPVLELYNSKGEKILENDNWDSANTAEFQSVGAGAWTAGSKDAAIITNLQPGPYTAMVRGKNSGTGIAIVEVFESDLANTAAKLVNISSRSLVKTGDEIMIAGFVIGGSQAKTVIVRASGPALVPAGITNYLPDPVLEIYNSKGVKILENDNWDAAAATDFKAVGASSWTTGSKDAAMVTTLQPGAYTAMVRDKNGATGVGLVEVYDR